MRRRFFLNLALFMLLIAGNGCIFGFASIRGSGDVVTVRESFDDFDSLRVRHGCRLTVGQSESYSVTVRIDDNLQQYLEVRRDGRTLVIGLESGHSYRNVHCEADIQMPDLREMNLSGGSRGLLDGFRARGDVQLGLSGGSRLEGMIDAGHMDVGASGGAEVELSGRSESLELDGSGGSWIRLSALETGAVRVNLSGGSQCSINLDGELTGSMSGGSSVVYSGSPTEIRVSKSGGARVSRR